jgi:lipopolysaccharide export system protein LptC
MSPVIAARTGPQTAHSYWTVDRGDNERAFRAARRHSRLVRVLRVAVPLAVVLGAVITVLVTYFNPLRMLGNLPVDVGKLVVSGTKITMEKPRLAGFTRDGRAYELTADDAAQDLTKPDILELKNIHAKVQMQDKSSITLSAATGVYDSKADTVKLNRDIVVTSTAGYQGKLSEATIDIHKGNVNSDHPVALTMQQGTLNANALQIVNSGDLVRFSGGVTVVLIPSQTDAAKPAANPAGENGAPLP